MQPPSSMTGRVLSEVLARRSAVAPLLASVTQVSEIRSGGLLQRIQRTQVGSAVYLDGGWAEAAGAGVIKTTEVA